MLSKLTSRHQPPIHPVGKSYKLMFVCLFVVFAVWSHHAQGLQQCEGRHGTRRVHHCDYSEGEAAGEEHDTL